MAYPKAFFDLQLQFAQKVAALSGLPFPEALLKYTNLYVRFGLGRDFNPAHPTWRAYLAGVQGAGDLCEWTYCFYQTRAGEMAGPLVVATVGCFSYAPERDACIRIHFQSAVGYSSLGAAHVERRRAELAELFKHVEANQPEHMHVVGVSWLYNLEAYRRLFPASYTATARAVHDRFHGMSLWGQFLDRNGCVKETMVRQFLARLEEQTCAEWLNECFPFQVQRVEASVQDFYRFYGL